tara:strand:- start:114467 stop:114931 length:465 start_codon:yes stop_codon:yes gene_type:complete
MKLSSRGGTKFQRHVVDVAGVFMCKQLGLTRYPSLEVVVKIKKVDDGFNGYCYPTEYGDIISKPRDITVEVSKSLDLYSFIRTICHEFVHVKQYVKGEIREDLINGSSMWKKGRVPQGTPYLEQPWEKEAFRLENQYALDVIINVEIAMNGETL